MAQINKSSDYFNTKLYTGTGSSNAITGVGFQPDLVWLKYRTSTADHKLCDIVRGVPNILSSNLSDAELSTSNFSSIDSDGFTVTNNNSGYNLSGGNYASWNWLAGGTASSNTDGSITSNVSANTTSGFSIVTYTTPSSGTVTVGHGLGVKPAMLITKSRDNAYNWDILHKSINDNGVGGMTFTTNGYLTGSSPYASTTPTASVFSFSADFYGASDNVTYCFAEKKGFSKFGSYTGNGSTDGTFIYTGFKPAFLLTKKSSASGDSWNLLDATRNPNNAVDKRLTPDTSNVEATTTQYDFLSNGFKVRASTGAVNTSGATYIYMAFAENPLVGTNNIPATAR